MKFNRQNISDWLHDRLSLALLKEILSAKTVPNHKHTFWYFFGGLCLLFFVIQICTGMLLLLYYSPTPDTAHKSVEFIMNDVSFGWIVRSIHSWSAHLMVAVVLIHLISTYFMKAYRKPREMVWISGILTLFLILGFAFTGFLLPWDTTAYFATQIGTEVPRSVPIIGDIMVQILRGGEYVGEFSLQRFFALHTVILPLVTLLLISIHIILNQIKGTSVPIGTDSVKKSIRFYPNFLFKDILAWLVAICVLFFLALMFPVQLGTKADPLSSAPLGIKPEWYFLSLFQTLKIVPSTVLGLNGEMLVNLIVGIMAFILILLPLIDHKANREEQSHLFTIVGLIILTYLFIMTLLAFIGNP